MIIKDYIINISLVVFFFTFNSNISNADDALLEDKIIINWQKGYIISKGKASVTFNNGAPVDADTERIISINKARQASYTAAKEIAILNMTEAIKYIRIDARNNLLEIIKNDPKTQKNLSNIINKNITYKKYPVDFDSSICEAKLNFGSIIASIPYDFPSLDFPIRAEIPISTPYSSVIVDCKGFNIKPMLFPSIYSDVGLEIYGKNFIQSTFAVKGGMVSYCYNEDQAYMDKRTGEHPYYTAAIKSLNNCPVLSEKDVRRILSSRYTIKNLKKCRVILIIDRENL